MKNKNDCIWYFHRFFVSMNGNGYQPDFTQRRIRKKTSSKVPVTSSSSKRKGKQRKVIVRTYPSDPSGIGPYVNACSIYARLTPSILRS
jgi:hypothetical protein